MTDTFPISTDEELRELVTCSKSHSYSKPKLETLKPVPLVWEATTMIFLLG